MKHLLSPAQSPERPLLLITSLTVMVDGNPGFCCPVKRYLVREDSTKIPSAEEYVILGVTIDNRLTFYNHHKNLCKKIANKLNALTRIAPYLNHNQIRLIYNSFFKGQLSYCPLIWTFCSRRSNHLINKLQEGALRIAYNDFNSSFSELLEMANENTIHIRNLKFFLTEVYKFLNGEWFYVFGAVSRLSNFELNSTQLSLQ